MGSQRKGLKLTKIPFAAWAIAFGTSKLPISELRSEHIIRKALQRTIELHYLVLKSVAPNSNYGLAKSASK